MEENVESKRLNKEKMGKEEGEKRRKIGRPKDRRVKEERER